MAPITGKQRPDRAVFLDRDGTLIQEENYLSRPEQVRLLPGVPGALKSLQRAGFKLFMVTNQSGIGRGFFTAEDLARVHEHLFGLFAPHGITFDHVYVAPEAPGMPSRWRKPSPDALFDARDRFNVELGSSYFIGDKWIDLECGRQAGVRKSLLVRSGYGGQTEAEYAGRLGDVTVVDDLPAAAEWILAQGEWS